MVNFSLKKRIEKCASLAVVQEWHPCAPHIFDQLKRIKTDRKITFWYGGRSKRELFYMEEFEQLEKEFPNFSLHVALSDPLPEDNWEGSTGFYSSSLLRGVYG